MGEGFSERGPTERRPEAQGEKSLEGEHRQGHRRPGSRTPKSDARRDSHPSVLLTPFQTRCPRPVPETPRVCPCLRACPGCSLSWSNLPPAPATPAPPRPAALRPHAGLLKTDPTFHSRHSLTLVPTHAHAHAHACAHAPFSTTAQCFAVIIPQPETTQFLHSPAQRWFLPRSAGRGRRRARARWKRDEGRLRPQLCRDRTAASQGRSEHGPAHAHTHTRTPPAPHGPQALPAGPGPPQRKDCSSGPLGRWVAAR